MSRRMPKVNELLRQQLSELIHEKVGGKTGLVTVTDVETTSDLQLATVHISVFGGDPEAARERLQERAHFFQQQLGDRLHMKFIPKLTFAINDESKRERVEKILEELP